MNNLVGKTIGRYKIVEKLAKGGMADIYKAEDTHVDNRLVIIKIIRKNDRYAEDFLKRFRREIKVLANLSHPYTAKIIDAGEYTDLPYLVMEYLPGGTLEEKLSNPIPWQESVRLLLPIAQALAYIHKQNILHRDIKPSNILFTKSGAPMLSDFGIVKILDRETPGEGTSIDALIGTPGYMAPEQVRCEKVDQRTDIYVLGIVFYEMVTGKKPYPKDTPLAASIKAATEPSVPSPNLIIPDLPNEIEQVILKALEKKPEDRYQSMDVLVQVLENLNSDRELLNRSEKPPSTSAEPLRVQETPSPDHLPEEHVITNAPPTNLANKNTANQQIDLPYQDVTPKGIAWLKTKRLRITIAIVGSIIILSLILKGVILPPTPTPASTPSTETPQQNENQSQEPTNIIFEDDFSNQKDWNTFSEAYGFAKYSDERLRLYVTNNMEIWSRNLIFSYGDVRIEVDATMSGDSLSNHFGIICRYQDDQNFYMALITSDGFQGIGLHEQGVSTLLTGDNSLLPSTAIKLGTSTNHIRFDCINSILKLYVNNQLVAYASDDTFPSDGAIGLIAATYSDESTDISFDNLIVYQP